MLLSRAQKTQPIFLFDCCLICVWVLIFSFVNFCNLFFFNFTGFGRRRTGISHCRQYIFSSSCTFSQISTSGNISSCQTRRILQIFTVVNVGEHCKHFSIFQAEFFLAAAASVRSASGKRFKFFLKF